MNKVRLTIGRRGRRRFGSKQSKTSRRGSRNHYVERVAICVLSNRAFLAICQESGTVMHW